jgi:hypothetical protein
MKAEPKVLRVRLAAHLATHIHRIPRQLKRRRRSAPRSSMPGCASYGIM